MKEALRKALLIWRSKQTNATESLKRDIESILVSSIEKHGNLAVSLCVRPDANVNLAEIIEWVRTNLCAAHVTEQQGVTYLHVAYKGYL